MVPSGPVAPDAPTSAAQPAKHSVFSLKAQQRAQLRALRVRSWHVYCSGPFCEFATNAKGGPVSYLVPSEFVTKMVDAGEFQNLHVDPRHARPRLHGRRHSGVGRLVRGHDQRADRPAARRRGSVPGRILHAVSCWASICLTGVFVLSPLAWLDKRPGVTIGGVLRNWGLVFLGNFAGALTVGFLDGVRDDVRLHAAAGQGRHRDRQHRRSPNARLRGARCRRAW